MNEFPFIVMTIPERKKPCLFYKEAPNKIIKIASFNDEISRDIFIEKMNKWIKDNAV